MDLLLPGGSAGCVDGTVVPEMQEVHDGGPKVFSPDRFRRESGMQPHLLEGFIAGIDADVHPPHDLALCDVVCRFAQSGTSPAEGIRGLLLQPQCPPSMHARAL
jgi:hypothetical protein